MVAALIIFLTNCSKKETIIYSFYDLYEPICFNDIEKKYLKKYFRKEILVSILTNNELFDGTCKK